MQPASGDDKAKVATGEPDHPVEPGVRASSAALMHEDAEVLARLTVITLGTVRV